MTLTTNITAGVRALLTGSTDLARLSAPHAKNFSATWGSGTGLRQADLVWGDNRQIAASSSEDLDLAGVLAGPLGGTMAFARIKAIMVTADLANINNVVVGGAASNPFIGPFGAGTHTIAVQPGGMYMAVAPSAAGWPVTASTADILKVANSGSGTPVNYSILLVGASA